MSKTFPSRQIVRCPLCHDGRQPQHIGHGVMLCECCGSTFRVVFATLGKTGHKLGRFVSETVSFGSQGNGPK